MAKTSAVVVSERQIQPKMKQEVEIVNIKRESISKHQPSEMSKCVQTDQKVSNCDPELASPKKQSVPTSTLTATSPGQPIICSKCLDGHSFFVNRYYSKDQSSKQGFQDEILY